MADGQHNSRHSVGNSRRLGLRLGRKPTQTRSSHRQISAWLGTAGTYAAAVMCGHAVLRKSKRRNKAPRLPAGRHQTAVLSMMAISLWVFLMGGCMPSPGPGGMTRKEAGLTYADGVFSAHVQGQLCRTAPDGAEQVSLVADGMAGVRRTGEVWTVEAEVTAGAPTPEGGRTVEVRYTAPATLAGLVVTRTTTVTPGASGESVVSTRVTLTFGEMHIDTTEKLYDRLLAPVDALLAEGDILSIEHMEKKDQPKGWTVTVGPCLSTELCQKVYAFIKGQEMPICVTVQDAWGEAVWQVEPLS